MDSIERAARALERVMGGTGPPGRDATAALLAARVGRHRSTADYRHGLRRGRCHRRGCASTFAIVRVTVDTRDPERTDRSATLECALCGRVWGGTTVPDLRLTGGALPRVLVTLILPPAHAPTFGLSPRGLTIRHGTDARIVRNATYTALAAALADWRERSGRVLGRRHDATAKRHAQEQADMDEARAWREQRERMAAIDAALIAAESPIA